MSISVAVIFTRKFRGRVKICPELMEGITRCGDRAFRVDAHRYQGPFSDVAVFYGFDGSRESRITQAFNDYKSAGKKAVYIDLGYWSRRAGGRWAGYHRFAINDRHPTAYFQNVKHKSDRFKVHRINLEPWRKDGRKIVLCGMSDKCARFEGFKFEQWERAAIKKIRAVTDRPIIYRPKPRTGDRLAAEPHRPIEGVEFSDPTKGSLEQELRDAWAVVSHHSNAGIDGICMGVPCFTDEGVALKMGKSDLSEIENRHFPSEDERRQWAYDVAYCQFNVDEMRDGTFWRHFKDEGLVP
jgi:hypothetical protein